MNTRHSNGWNMAKTDELAARCRRGDMQAFDELVECFQTPIFNLALRMTNDYHRAGDATQEIFVKAYRSIGKFRAESGFKTWLFAIAANTCRNDWRTRQRRLRHETTFSDCRDADTDADPEPACAADASPADLAQNREFTRQIEEAVARLPHDFSIVLTLRDLRDMTYEEIAQTLDCSIGTVKSRLSRARTMLKNQLLALWPEMGAGGAA